MWDNRTNEWQKRDKPGSLWLNFRLPAELLPVELTRARLVAPPNTFDVAVADGLVVTVSKQGEISTVDRSGANAVFLLASDTLDRDTDMVDQIRRAIGNRLAGVHARISAQRA